MGLKRTPLRRRTPLQRSSSLQRTGRLRPVNPERAAIRKARDFGDLAAFVRPMKCCACGSAGPCDPAHVKSRGAGGHAWMDNGDGNIIALCRRCHTEQHSRGWGAIFDHARDPRSTAEHYARYFGEEFLAAGGERY